MRGQCGCLDRQNWAVNDKIADPSLVNLGFLKETEEMDFLTNCSLVKTLVENNVAKCSRLTKGSGVFPTGDLNPSLNRSLLGR